jgi:excisionase family DNA binding protein
MKTTEDAPLTMTVPEAAAKYFGLGRKAAYALAAKGELPTVRLGRTLRVPVRALERMLEQAGEKGAA